MASINFLYRSKKEKSSLVLRLLYRHNDNDYVYGVKTRLEVTKDFWSKDRKLKRPKDINVSNQQVTINTKLNKIENFILSAFRSQNNLENVNKKWLQNQLDSFYNPNKEDATPTELLKYFDRFLKIKEKEITFSSLKKYKTVRNLLSKYEAEKKSVTQIKDVDANFKNCFEDYCLRSCYSQNTINWTLRSIKTVCNHARYNGVETSVQLNSLKSKSQTKDKIYLNFDELKLIENIPENQLTESLNNAKDWLIISCYLGQRVSDLMNFSSENIRVEKGKNLLEFRQKKTNKLMTIPMHSKVLEILEVRDGNFPRPISSQKYNIYIKTVCKIAGINEITNGSKKVLIDDLKTEYPYRNLSGKFEKWDLITSHIGRRSFATNFYGKIPTSFLIYMTGHSTEQMFLKYIGKSNKDLALEITNYF